MPQRDHTYNNLMEVQHERQRRPESATYRASLGTHRPVAPIPMRWMVGSRIERWLADQRPSSAAAALEKPADRYARSREMKRALVCPLAIARIINDGVKVRLRGCCCHGAPPCWFMSHMLGWPPQPLSL